MHELLKLIIFISISVLVYYLFDNPSDELNSSSDPIDPSEDSACKRLNMAHKLSAFVLGATGEVGKEIVKVLANTDRFGRVVLISRREVPIPTMNEYSKFEQKLIDFEKMASGENETEYLETFRGFDVGFCALGTTRGKAGREGFIRVDHDYVMAAARFALAGGLKHFSLVSSSGANSDSYFLYPKVKGEVEDEIRALGFERTSIYRPSLLLCNRQEQRHLESAARAIVSLLDRWMIFSVKTSVVAQVMVNNTMKPCNAKVEIFTNSDINSLNGQN